jgi:hypothetical protein
MICETCQGHGYRIKFHYDKTSEEHSSGKLPCPECDGSGIAHCCEGLREQVETKDNEECP